jgi:hypothetical protein
MKMFYFEDESLPIGVRAQHWLGVVANVMKDFFSGDADQENRISYWQLIFSQSRANGCSYHFDDLPQVSWQWPKDTWFQERLSQKLGDAEYAAHL